MRAYTGILLLTAAILGAQERFEVAGWVDSFDFARAKVDGELYYDIETTEGSLRVLSHVLETGTNTVLWRNCGGATMRYGSREDSHHGDAPKDKRRLPDNRDIHGWLRFGDMQPDGLRHILGVCHERGVRAGVHWPFEENHWSSWTYGGWNLDHPQYWVRDQAGTPWCGRSSFSYPEVVEHKLRLLDELVERGMDTLFIDTWRSGAWTPAWEYVPPVVESWRQKTGKEPPKDPRDPAWCRHVSTHNTAFLKAVRQRLDAAGRPIRLYVGVSRPDPNGDVDEPLLTRGIDWRALVREGVVDTLVVNIAIWDRQRPFESTEAYYRAMRAAVGPDCRLLLPVRAYDYDGGGMPSYAKATKLKQEDIAARLVRLAWESGANGISLECVDHDNYRPATRKVMRELVNGDCQSVRSMPD
jgi:hypothetical protein